MLEKEKIQETKKEWFNEEKIWTLTWRLLKE
jgi:hypothetical protein